MRRSAVSLVIVLACLAGLWWWKTRGEPLAEQARSGSATAGSAAAVAPTPAPIKKPPAHATRISPEERKQLADRIAAAQRARSAAPAHAASNAPSLPAGSDIPQGDLDHIATNVMGALKEAIPFLAECYKVNAPAAIKDRGLTVRAAMTLTTDPDIGTVIDADQIYDDNHQPLDKKLDDCLRNTMQTLELPPLEDGQTARVEYSFQFGDEDK